MFLTKSLEELKTSIDVDSPLIKEHDTIKRYMLTRLKLDEDLIKFNKQHTLDVSDLKQILAEDGISTKRVETAVTVFPKFNYKQKPTVDNVFELIIGDLTERYKPTYLEYKSVIQEYVSLLINHKEEKINFRNKQKLVLKELREEMYYTGLFPVIYNGAYASLKLTLNNYKALNKPIDEYRSELVKNHQNEWEYILTDIFLTELNRLGISECVK